MFAQICDLEQLVGSYYLARRGKRDKPRICEFDFFLESNLVKLRYLLNSGNYIPSPYAHFTIYDPKTRQVAAPAFRDRVLQHSLVSTIEPFFEKRFIFDSYACRKGKGTHFGAKRVRKFLMAARCINGSDKEIYILQCDIQNFFQSISWDVLLASINKVVKCSKTLDLIQKIVTTHEKTTGRGEEESNQLSLFSTVGADPPAVSVEERRGLPIGNLTSQLFANIYLNELDHFVKETLRERWYARYMDDFLIIHPDKNHLCEAKERIRIFLKETLNLRLHPKKIAIKNVKEGVPFVGYRTFYDHILVRGSTLRRMQKKYRKRIKLFQKGLISDNELSQTHSSMRGHLKHADAHRLYFFMVENYV
ncbi:MAG: reverse transcriptase/maturase family protein [Sphaerochaetaceae bacterium]